MGRLDWSSVTHLLEKIQKIKFDKLDNLTPKIGVVKNIPRTMAGETLNLGILTLSLKVIDISHNHF